MILFKRFAFITAGRVIAVLLQAITLVLVARQAGPVAFGALSAFLGIIVVLQTALDFGIATYITRSRAIDPQAPEIGLALRLYRWLGIMLGSLLAIAAIVVSILTEQPWWVFLALAFSGCVDRQSDIRLTVAMADGDVWKNNLNLVFRRVIVLGAFLLATPFGLNVLLKFGLASVIGACVSLWISHKLIVIRLPDNNIQMIEAKAIFAVSKSFWFHSIGVQARNLDVVIVGILTAPIVAGHYGIIARSLGPLQMLASSLAAVLLPMASKEGGRASKNLVIPVAVVMGTVVVLYGILAVHAEMLVESFLGEAFAPATAGFQLVLAGLVFASLSSVLAAFFQASGREVAVAKVSVGSSVLSLISVATGAVFYGVTGAAAGLAATYFLQSILLIAYGMIRRPQDLLSR